MKTIGNEPITAIKDVWFDVDTESIAFNPSKADFRASFAGLTKREYFAALAMQGLRASKLIRASERIAKLAVEDADALIEELNKKENQ